MKKLSILNFILIIILLDIFLIGCNNEQQIDSEPSNEEFTVYQAYENYVKSLGKTAVDYEEFLSFIKAKDGENGKDGIDGKNGINGKSAYELAVENGFEGSVEEWLLSLKGEKGQDGEDGKDGKNGIDGIDGINGDNGTNGKDGTNGQNGIGITNAMINENGNLIITYSNGFMQDCGKVVGEKGVDGKDGTNGSDGRDGKDGINGTNGKDGENGKDGKQGVQGIQGIQGIQGEKGETGEKGQDGVGIKEIILESTNATEDVYHIILTNGTICPFTIPKQSITSDDNKISNDSQKSVDSETSIDNGASKDLHYVYDKQKDVYLVVGAGLSTDMDIVISSHYNDKRVSTIYQNAFENQCYIRSVVLNDGIFEIGQNAFCNCSSLQAVKIPKSVCIFDVTSFENCFFLDKIQIEIFNKLENKYEYKTYNSIEDIENDIENFSCDENGCITRKYL